MKDREKEDLLKAAMAVAAADGVVKPSEMGVILGLAVRVGVGQISMEHMIEAAKRDPAFADNILMSSQRSARLAMELLVAQARIDGEISDEERELLVRLATRLQIPSDAFQAIYREGIARADRIRKSRGL